MIKYDNLIGLEWKPGSNDCYGLVRVFYKQNYDIDLPNYARSADWWTSGVDLFSERYYKNGFSPIDLHPSDYQVGDVFLMTIRSTVPNHVAILVENGRILHHFTNRLSEVEFYKGIWRNTTVAVLRHKDVKPDVEEKQVSILDILPEHVRRKINAELATSDTPPQEV